MYVTYADGNMMRKQDIRKAVSHRERNGKMFRKISSARSALYAKTSFLKYNPSKTSKAGIVFDSNEYNTGFFNPFLKAVRILFQSNIIMPKNVRRPSPQSYSIPHFSVTFRTKIQ